MAKKAILDVLESTIGKYVRNLDSESLNVAIWSGKIELNSLELNVDAVNAELDRQAAEAPNLAAPFRVTGGHFGNFEVDVPWSRLSSQSVVLRARGLQVSVEPYDRLSKIDHLTGSVTDEQRIQKAKEQRNRSIKAYDDYRQQANSLRKLAEAEEQTDDSKGSDAANDSTFTGRLVRRIIENLQVEIDDVHISLKTVDSSAGVVLGSLSLVTTDRSGRRAFVDRTGTTGLEKSFLYKALRIQGLGIYLDEVQSALSRPFTIAEGSAALSAAAQTTPHTYILAPLSFEAKLRQSDDIKCVNHPKYLLSSQLSNLSILLSRTQLELARKIQQAISPPDGYIVPLFPEYRPLSRLSRKTAREWWQYAIRCVGRINGRSLWLEFFCAFQKRKRYIPLYKRKAHAETCSWVQPLESHESAELQELEDDRSISLEGLMAWRTIADAQIEKEQEKADFNQKKKSKKTSGVLSSFFGTSSSTAKDEAEEDPPIVLSVDEMKELESISLQQSVDTELTKDSKLCYVTFVLGSFKINLSTYGMKPVLELSLGRVGASFDAMADGSYEFGFDLSSLEVRDSVTPRSLFPVVLRNILKEDSQFSQKAFELKTKKERTGDQVVIAKLMAIEMVASPMLVIETKKFFSTTKEEIPASAATNNPMLAQSMTGSVDLFYDAAEGSLLRSSFTASRRFSGVEALLLSEDEEADDVGVTDKMASAMMEAWKQKSKEQIKWTIDCDVHAPIIIVPENCVNVAANALMFDLGHLRFKYGGIDVPPSVQRWLDKHPIPFNSSLDPGSVTMENLAIYARKTKEIASASPRLVESTKGAILEPLSVSLDVGIESKVGEASPPRVCAFGTLPSISLVVSPEQVAASLTVVKQWKSVAASLSQTDEKKGTEIVEEGQTVLEASISSLDSAMLVRRPSKTQKPSEAGASTNEEATVDTSRPSSVVFVTLKRLSLMYREEDGVGVDAHLVSVDLKSSQYADGSSEFRLRMGWFWIHDKLRYDFPRCQRLVAHSKLPLSATEFAAGQKYDIINELAKQGVFKESFGGSSDLADISLVRGKREPSQDKLLSMLPHGNDVDAEVLTDVTMSFSTLFVNWNPRSIAILSSTLNGVLLTVSGGGESAPSRDSPGGPEQVERNTKAKSESLMQIKATLEKLELCLRSARDDDPIFVATVSRAKVGLLLESGERENTIGLFDLGDVRLESSSIESVRPEYKTVLGLAPGQHASLLQVRYCQGKQSLLSMENDLVKSPSVNSFAEIQLSPMRLVYLQAQVLTLVEYATEGILGTLTARAASNVASAAVEMVATAESSSVFSVKATGFDAVLPEAAESHRHFLLRASALDVVYYGEPSPKSNVAEVKLEGVTLSDHGSVEMTRAPVGMKISVTLPPAEIGSIEDQKLRCDLSVDEAQFIVGKDQYQMIFDMLDGNIGEADPKLRETIAVLRKDGDQELVVQQTSTIADGDLTHGGVVFVERKQRMSVDISMGLLSLELCGRSTNDSIVKLSAEDGKIVYTSQPDSDMMITDITLHALTCDDSRPRAEGRQFRKLFSHDDGTEVFRMHYSSNAKTRKSILELKLGSPQAVFVPDVISDVLEFVTVSSRKPNVPVEIDGSPDGSALGYGSEVDIENDMDGIEVTPHLDSHLSHSTLSVKTEMCRFILVDLGSSVADATINAQTHFEADHRTTEAIILRCGLSTTIATDTDQRTGETEKSDIEFHGKDFEVYTASGEELKAPIQILEPTSVTVMYSTLPSDGAILLDLKAVTLNPIDVAFSMQNLALISAISSSLSDSLESRKSAESDVGLDNVLSEEEAQRIERLANALEATEQTETSVLEARSVKTNMDSVSVGSSIMEKPNLSKKWNVRLTFPAVNFTMINDLQGVDDALLRLRATNIALGLEADEKLLGGLSQWTYDFHTNSSLLADYFDISMHRWKRLLTRPWEVNVKSSRGLNRRFRSNRLSTTVDVESFPCHLSISEQFLISLGSANRMWQVYAAATASASQTTEGRSFSQESLKRALAANAARNLVVSLPYGVENNCGHDVHFTRDIDFDSGEKLLCAVGKVRYFRFNVASGEGVGGKRLYGQDIEKPKSLSLIVDGTSIAVNDMDGELGHPRKTHTLESGGVIITEIVKIGNTTTLRIASHVEMTNGTSIPFHVAIVTSSGLSDIGICRGTQNVDGAVMEKMDGNNTKASKRFGIPTRFVGNAVEDKTCTISVSPCLPGASADVKFKGKMTIPTTKALLLKAGNRATHSFDVTCRADDASRTKLNPDTLIPFVVHVKFEMVLANKRQPLLNIILKPRLSIENKTPIALALKTPMPFTFAVHKTGGKATKKDLQSETDVVHTLESNDSIQVFSPSASIAVALKCSDQPVGGGLTGWIQGDWVDLPMIPEFRLHEPLRCIFPFQNTRSSIVAASGQRTHGIEFYIVDKVVDLSMLSSETVRKEVAKTEESQGEELLASSSAEEEAMRQYFITVSNYGVDHTGEILFEQLMMRKPTVRQSARTSASLRRSSLATPSSTPFSAFATHRHLGRVSLLPMADVPLRLLHLTMEGDVGLRRSLPFSVDDVSICNGGVESTAILWEDGSGSGFYAYRTLVDSYQSELHVVPEFVIHNGSKEHAVLVRQQTGNGPVSEIMLEASKVAPIRRSPVGLILSFHYVEFGGFTPWMRFEGLSHKVSVVRTMDNTPIGSLACQTVIGSKDSRFVVKLAPIKWANAIVSSGHSLLKDDFLRFRVRWSELRVCVKESHRGESTKSVPIIESALDHIFDQSTEGEAGKKKGTNKREQYATWQETRLMRGKGLGDVDEGNDDKPVFTIIFQRFTMDWQKVFKETQGSIQKADVKNSPERSQVSVIIHHLQILDDSPKAHFPIVFSSKSSLSFIDLCIRVKGPLDVDLIKVDLVDLNLCNVKGKSEKIVISTSEEFVWNVLDVADRILMATKELAGVDMQLQWNEATNTFDVVVTETAEHLTERVNYVPPESNTLYHVNKIQVSPFTILASFKRQPQKSRYKLLKGVQGAKIVNYFTTRLKFTLDRAELKFARYTTYEPIKGPADRLVEHLAAIYVARTKMKMVSILSAVSFQDWKYLASRDDGGDSYKEGDLLRVAGNGVGGGANFVLKKMGSGLGKGVATVGHTLGDGIENAAGAVGARTVGAGVNSIVSGIGDGVGDTVKGVGNGAGKVVKGAGKGVGQIFGGVTGGVLMVGKGIGKGVTTGDATAIASGFKDGAVSIGAGVGTGLETAVVGVGDGVYTVGKGVFSGVKNVGKGIGDFTSFCCGTNDDAL